VFNATYLKTDADVVEDLDLTRKEVQTIQDILHLPTGANILDLCCGQGRHLFALASLGFCNLEGLDRSHYLIQKAKAMAKKEGAGIKFREGDARRLPYPPDSFDYVLILGNSFGYFDAPEDDLRVLREVLRVLKPSGLVLIDVADGAFLKASFQKRSWEWIGKKQFVCRERALSNDQGRLITREIVVHAEKGILVDQFYAERIYTQASLEQLLRGAGFQGVAFHGETQTESSRNQDLGMMERRLWLSGQAKKEWTTIKPKPKAKACPLSIVVILGDPSKPDPIKPFGLFDEDDLCTIDRLKEALGTQAAGGRWRFRYLNRHDTLLQDLVSLKEKGQASLVFNLCDEGYLNDASKELNVPALLDILDLPYTGAQPQCLAFCYDKSLVRGVAKEMGIPVPEAILVGPEERTLKLSIPFPVIVKPNFGDNSFGITKESVVLAGEDLFEAIARVRSRFGYERPILIEELLTGADLSVGILGNLPDAYSVLPILEEDYSGLPPGCPRIRGYEAKWLPDSPFGKVISRPSRLDSATERFLIESSLRLFERLGARDYCRFDWRMDASGMPRLLEVNPNPGWSYDSQLAKMAQFANMSYPDLLGAILEAAIKRDGKPKR
jgi:D-alanine-D-alanine ligase